MQWPNIPALISKEEILCDECILMFSYIYCPHFSFQARRGLFIIGRVLVEVAEWGSSGKGNEMGK
jgi:hypothetical protein